MGSYRVQPLCTVADLERLAAPWDALAEEVPFRGPTWLLTWWRHYGITEATSHRRRLFSPAVFRDNRLIALAPWYIERTAWGGNVIRPLGSGRVCSDYQTICCQRGDEPEAAHAVAEFLCHSARDEWDRLDLDAATLGDRTLAVFFEALAAEGAEIERRPGVNSWRIALPAAWDDYLRMLSKSHRKQLRRLAAQVFDTPRAVWHTTTQPGEFDRDWTLFLDLHQRRRHSLGEVGGFADPKFAAFHEDIARQFLAQGRLRLHRLELDGRPVAAEYHLAAKNVVYAYQSGLEPEALAHEPGRVAAIAVIRGAIASGFSHYDLLRGDEPYKAHWRAKPFPAENVSLSAPRTSSRIRFALRRHARKVRSTLAKHP